MAVKQVAVNKKARHDYEVLKQVEAGLALLGSEIKSIREGRVQIREAYARPEGGELWLIGAHISQYAPAGDTGHEPTRKRKLLLHKSQIRELSRAVLEQGLTLVPLRMYLKDGIAKVEIALAKGKKRHDKRASIAKRDAEREMARAVRHRQ